MKCYLNYSYWRNGSKALTKSEGNAAGYRFSNYFKDSDDKRKLLDGFDTPEEAMAFVRESYTGPDDYGVEPVLEITLVE